MWWLCQWSIVICKLNSWHMTSSHCKRHCRWHMLYFWRYRPRDVSGSKMTFKSNSRSSAGFNGLHASYECSVVPICVSCIVFPPLFDTPNEVNHAWIWHYICVRKLKWSSYQVVKKFDNTQATFDAGHKCYRWTPHILR